MAPLQDVERTVHVRRGGPVQHGHAVRTTTGVPATTRDRQRALQVPDLQGGPPDAARGQSSAALFTDRVSFVEKRERTQRVRAGSIGSIP